MPIMKRKWTRETAVDYVISVETGKSPHGLKYCSAISYLGVYPGELLEKLIAAEPVKRNDE